MEETVPARAPGAVVIGIPTFRRPARLARLLASLEPSLDAVPGVRILVADNGCDEETRRIVEAFDAERGGVDYLAVQKRGISANRNALIETFLRDAREAHWLAMLDDDLAVGPRWLPDMLAVARKGATNAIVGGPYAYTAPVASFVVRNSIFVQRARRETGDSAPFFAAGNVLLPRDLLEGVPPLRFDEAFGLSGGEDYDFFSRAAARGARFAWCDEAFGDEQVDEARLTPRAVAYRYFSSGNYMAVADAKRMGRGTVARSQARLLAQSLGLAGWSVLRLDRAKALTGCLRLLVAAGGLASLVGYRVYRYR